MNDSHCLQIGIRASILSWNSGGSGLGAVARAVVIFPILSDCGMVPSLRSSGGSGLLVMVTVIFMSL